MRIGRENLSIKWLICFLLRRHKWGYEEAGGKGNYNCRCDMNNDCSSIPVYDLTCLRCGLSITLGEDELISCFCQKNSSTKGVNC